MHIITKKVRIAGTPFVGTRIRLRLDDPESLTWGMSFLLLDQSRGTATVDWGDGVREEIREDGPQRHVYAQPDEYEVRISDDLTGLGVSKLFPGEFRDAFAPMIRAFRTTATRLCTLENFCFTGARNLSVFSCGGSGLKTLSSRSFANCTSLLGRIDLPGIVSLPSDSFIGDSGLTELHFSAANEQAIKALPAWEGGAGKFGAENATAYFDL